MPTAEPLAVLKALADPMRLEILRQFDAQHPVASGEILSACPRSQPTVSHHLGTLVEAGVLLEQKHGTQKRYELNAPLLAELGIDLTRLTNPDGTERH